MSDDQPTPAAVERSPLRQLWDHARGHRRRMVLASIFSFLNKLCDIAPELLIGVAVDVVVNDGQSLVGRLTGVEDPYQQLTIVAVVTVVVWVLESITDYTADLLWRNLAQDIEHDMRMEAYGHVQRLEL